LLGNAGDIARAEAELDRALELNPNSAIVLFTYAGWASGFGKLERGIEAADHVRRLDPSYPVWAGGFLTYAYFMGGRYAEVPPIFERTPRESRLPDDWAFAAGSHAALGRGVEARATVTAALADYPDLTIEGVTASLGWTDAERERLIEAMRAAGFPPCAKGDGRAAIAQDRRLPECASAAAGG
jgi:tetratricopeptide (TPR) repeat protein